MFFGFNIYVDAQMSKRTIGGQHNFDASTDQKMSVWKDLQVEKSLMYFSFRKKLLLGRLHHSCLFAKY